MSCMCDVGTLLCVSKGDAKQRVQVPYQVDALDHVCVLIQGKGAVQDIVRDLQQHEISDQGKAS